MNWDTVKGNAQQLKGQLKSKWAKLTDDDFKLLEGKADDFFGRVQQRMGIARDKAEAEIDALLAQINKNQRPS